MTFLVTDEVYRRFVLCQPHYFEYSNEALIATARASDMSSGPAISFTPRVMATIFLSALLSHLPSPATTLLISVGENSRTGTPRPSETKTITPLASATASAVLLFLDKYTRSMPTTSGLYFFIRALISFPI